MKAIINSKRYDTETATEVACKSHGRYNDFNWQKETLYRTEKGNFFLHGEGGAASDYSKSTGDGMTSGERIIPLKDDEAFAWAARKGLPEICEEYFPDHFEDA